MSGIENYSMSDLFFKSVLTKLAKKLEKETVEGVAGDGAVKVVVNGKQKVLKVSISPETSQDVGKFEKIMEAAINDALTKVHELIKAEIKKIAGNISWADELF